MAKLTITYEDLYTEVSNFLGLTVRGTAPTGTDLTTCQSIVSRGIRNFLYPLDASGRPHEWGFLRVPWSLTLTPGQWKYALPVDFSDICGTFHYEASRAYSPLLKRGAEQILDMRSNVITASYPEYFAITPLRYNNEIGTVYELWLYPNPGTAYVLTSLYRADPVKMASASDLTLGGIRAIEAIIECCLAEAEVQEDEVIGIHSQRAKEMVLTLIQFDSITTSDKTDNLYRNRDREWPKDRTILTYPNMGNVYQE